MRHLNHFKSANIPQRRRDPLQFKGLITQNMVEKKKIRTSTALTMVCCKSMGIGPCQPGTQKSVKFFFWALTSLPGCSGKNFFLKKSCRLPGWQGSVTDSFCKKSWLIFKKKNFANVESGLMDKKKKTGRKLFSSPRQILFSFYVLFCFYNSPYI